MDFFKIRRTSADPEFCRIFKNLLDSGANYCKLCLQTEADITLVPPNYVNQLLEHLKHLKVDMTNALVCIYCEGRAAAAVQIIVALYYAKDVGSLIESLNNKNNKEQLERYISKQSTSADLQTNLKRSILKCANKIIIPKKLHLNRTETLTIDLSVDPKNNNSNEENTVGKKGEIIISDDSDDECIYLPKINPKPIEQLLEKPNTQTSEPPLEVVVESDPLENVNLTAPIAMNSGFIPMQAELNQTGLLYVVDGKGTMTLHPLYKKDEGSYEVPTLTLKTLGKQSDTLNTLIPPIINSGKKLTMITNSINEITEMCININNENTLPKIISTSSVREEITNVNNGFTLPIITNAKSLNDAPGTVVEVASEENVLLKRLLDKDSELEPGGKKVKETDWEDKIPMDLISLADNSQSSICSIANVRSVR